MQEEGGGSMVECLNQDGGLQVQTLLEGCIVSMSIILFLYVIRVQPRKTCSNIAEKLLTGA